ncbi:MAG TPA: ATP-binding protein [Thermoanaerobaculia bacterium]
MIENREALESMLSAGSFDQLIGTVENYWFDAKEQPYDTGTDAGKRSLAKDITAFANAEGGVVLIGFRTKASATHFRDEVIAVRAFDQKLVDAGQYQKIADEWIYPPVERLEIVWLPQGTGAAKGVIVINVPPQRAELKPFLVAKTVDATKINETIFGYAERRGDANEPLRVGDLQRALRVGLHYERTLEGRLSAIEALLQNAGPPQVPPQASETQQSVTRRSRDAYQSSDFANDRAMLLTVYPVKPSELKTIFSSADETIRRKLENPPVLRSGGWDLATQQPGVIIRGELVRIRGFRRILDLYRDGTLVVGCLASDGFLAWTSPEQKLNPIGLVEMTYNVCAFYTFVLEDMRSKPEAIEIQMDLIGLHNDGVRTKLAPGTANQVFYQLVTDYIHAAPDESFAIRKQFRTAEYDPRSAAYQLLREVYLWFGFDEDKVPYVMEREGERLIDIDALRRG